MVRRASHFASRIELRSYNGERSHPCVSSARRCGPLAGAAAKLVIEVVDASLNDDLGQKLLDYAQAGLGEDWVRGRPCWGDPFGRRAWARGYCQRAVVRFGELAGALTLPLQLDTSTF